MGAVWFDSVPQRGTLVDQLLHALATARPDAPNHAGSSPLADDFLALGFCYLQTEVLTRRMRYASHLDESRFQESALAAARAWIVNDEAETKSRLTDCFQALVEAKSQFYSVDSYLIDVTLVEATTIGVALREELSGNTPRNVLITAETLRQLASQEPQTLQASRGPGTGYNQHHRRPEPRNRFAAASARSNFGRTEFCAPCLSRSTRPPTDRFRIAPVRTQPSAAANSTRSWLFGRVAHQLR